MRDPDRIHVVLGELERYWLQHDQLRLCQVLGNFFPGDNYYVEDDDVLEALRSER